MHVLYERYIIVKAKSDLMYYLLCDEIARLGEQASVFRKMCMGEMWFFQVHLKKLEYYTNTGKNPFSKMLRLYHRYKTKKLGMKLGWSNYPNLFGQGMCIVHYGTVVVNGTAQMELTVGYIQE